MRLAWWISHIIFGSSLLLIQISMIVDGKLPPLNSAQSVGYWAAMIGFIYVGAILVRRGVMMIRQDRLNRTGGGAIR